MPQTHSKPYRVQLSRNLWRGFRLPPWLIGRRGERRICVGCGLPRTSRPAAHCTEPRHAEYHKQRRQQNNLLRRNARAAARAQGKVKRHGTIEAKKAQSKRAYRKRKLAIIERLGGSCARCGLSDSRALQVHHRNGGGGAQRKSLGWRYHYRLARLSPSALREEFELLCANCHAIEHHDD